MRRLLQGFLRSIRNDSIAVVDARDGRAAAHTVSSQGTRAPVLQNFQKVNAIALETGGSSQGSTVRKPHGKKLRGILQGRPIMAELGKP